MTDFNNFNAVAEILSRCRESGGAAQFIENTQPFWSWWLRWCQRILVGFGHNTQCGEDVLQEVLLALFQAVSRGLAPPEVSRLAGYFWKVLRNCAIDHCKACRPTSGEIEISELPAEVRHDWALDYAALCRMANLTDEQAKLLRLWTEEDSAVAAAQRLGMSPDSVRSRLYRIRAKLRNRLSYESAEAKAGLAQNK